MEHSDGSPMVRCTKHKDTRCHSQHHASKQTNERSRDREFFVRSSSRITSPTQSNPIQPNPTQSRCSDDGLLRSPLGFYKIEHLSCFCSTVAVTITLLLSACAALILAASPPTDSRFVRSFVRSFVRRSFVCLFAWFALITYRAGYEIGEPVKLQCRSLRTGQWEDGPLCSEVRLRARCPRGALLFISRARHDSLASPRRRTASPWTFATASMSLHTAA